MIDSNLKKKQQCTTIGFATEGLTMLNSSQLCERYQAIFGTQLSACVVTKSSIHRNFILIRHKTIYLFNWGTAQF